MDIYAFGKTILFTIYQALVAMDLTPNQKKNLDMMFRWCHEEVPATSIVWAMRRLTFSNITPWYEIGIRCCVDNQLDMNGVKTTHPVPTIHDICALLI